jgi:AAA15 family ATPase/GTPase
LREDEEMIPLGMFGDAVRKATEILFLALTTDSKAIFIDEIENGLHHTKQADVWAALFEIAKERGIQVFATTHSKEMIESFARVGAKSENEGQGVYFEMYRSPRNGQIVAAPYKTEVLTDFLIHNERVRGEAVK